MVPRFDNYNTSPPTQERHHYASSTISLVMDSPIVANLFRQLFLHRPAGCHRRAAQHLRHNLHNTRHNASRRGYATKPSMDRGMKPNESRWQQRTQILPADRSAEFKQYPYITMEELKTRKERPRRVKMLMRDFIDGMRGFFLYHDMPC